MPDFRAAVKFNKVPVVGFVAETSGTAPSSPVAGQLWYDTSAGRLKVYESGAFVLVSDTGVELTANKNAAGGYAGLDGSSKLTFSQIPTGTTGTTVAVGNDSRIVGAEQTANKNTASGYAGLDGSSKLTYSQIPVSADGIATASTVVQATDSRLSNSRTPSGSAGGSLAGTYPNPTIAAGAITGTEVNASIKDAAAGTASLRTLAFTSTTAMPGNARLDQITAPTASIDFNSQRGINLAAPVNPNDAARLVDLQNTAAGIDIKPSARAATTANITLSGTQTIDGVAVIAGDRVVVKNQTTTTENGIYVVAAGAWARSSDTLGPNTFVFIEEGTTQADTAWMITNNGTVTPGTTAIAWAQFGAATTYTAGTGITVAGTVISINTSYVGQTSITTLGTITTGTWTATAVGVAYGGTGSTTAGGARTNLGVPQRGVVVSIPALTAGTPLAVTTGITATNGIAQVQDAATKEVLYPDVTVSSTTQVTIKSDVAVSNAAWNLIFTPID